MARGTTFTKTNFGIKIEKEDTPNTFKTPTNILCLEKGKGDIGLPEYNKYECDQMSEFDGDTYSIVTDPDSGKITIKQDIALQKVLDPSLETLFIGAGLTKTVVDNKSNFTPTTAFADRISMLVTQLRREYKIKGGIVEFTLDLQPSQMVRLQLEITGTLEGEITEKAPADQNFPIPKKALTAGDVAWIRSKCSLTINGEPMWISGAKLKLGLDIGTVDDYCGKISRVKNRKSTLEVTIKNTEQNETPIADLKNATSYVIALGFHDIDGNEIGKITAPNAIVDDDNPSDVDGYFETTRTFALNSVTGDDNFQITFNG